MPEPSLRRRFLSLRLALVVLLSLLFPSCGGVSGGRRGADNATPANWQYTAMGDSLAAGALASQGYVGRYHSNLIADANPQVQLVNLGVPGWTSSDLRRALTTSAIFGNTVSGSQVVTWDIGGDDLLPARRNFLMGTCGGADNQDCLRAAVSTFITNWNAIIAQILSFRSQQNTILRTMDVYYPFVAQDMAAGAFNVLKSYLDQVNAHIVVSAGANQVPVARISVAFNGPSGTEDPAAKGLISVDGLHPNDAGHKVIADTLRALGYAPLK